MKNIPPLSACCLTAAGTWLIKFFILRELQFASRISTVVFRIRQYAFPLPTGPNSLVTLLKMCMGYKTKD